MKVKLELSDEYTTPYAVIYADKVTDQIQQMMDILDADITPVIAFLNEDTVVILKPEEIYKVCIEGGDTIIYGKTQKYRSRKRLYELEQQLGKRFMQISKSTLVNLDYIDSVESGFNCTLLLKLKNGSKDYVSRTYLSKFKKYLGL